MEKQKNLTFINQLSFKENPLNKNTFIGQIKDDWI